MLAFSLRTTPCNGLVLTTSLTRLTIAQFSTKIWTNPTTIAAYIYSSKRIYLHSNHHS